jgi:hypothetical protein
MKPICQSCFPIGSWAAPLLPAAPLIVVSVVCACLDLCLPAAVFGGFGSLLLLTSIMLGVRWRCPRCQKRALRIAATGGIWYANDESFREERVFWGQCASCSQWAIRRKVIFATWEVRPSA